MAFKKAEVETLLAETGRRCCLCGHLHRVQVHHIVPREQGGTDDIDNGIPLCPNCHDEVHTGFAPGRTTRVYSPEELKLHRQRTIDQVAAGREWAPGTDAWDHDKHLILYYAQCLDRPAFRSHFHEELSFADFDRAMEDTLLALNTGYWRTRDGATIGRSEGKTHLLSQDWRDKLDRIVGIIEEIRGRFREALGLDEMLFRYRGGRHPRMDWMMDRRLRGNRELGRWMDEKRKEAIDLMNTILEEFDHPKLQANL